MCLKWTQERYGSLTPALCQACVKEPCKIEAEKIFDHHMKVVKELVGPKVEREVASYCQGETDLEQTLENNLPDGNELYGLKEDVCAQ